MALAAKIHRAARGHERQFVDMAGTLRDSASAAIDVVIEDLSRSGFRIQPGHDLTIGESISLGLPGMGVRSAEVVRHSDYGYGCEFLNPLGAEELTAVLAGTSVDPIPFPLSRLGAFSPDTPDPAERPYSRKVRLLAALGFAAMAWGMVALAIKAFA